MEIRSINQTPIGAARPRHALVVITVVIVTGLVYGWSLDDGLFLDDRWHQYALERADWSFKDLLEASTIEPQRFLHAWWQDETVRWDYSRPATMAWVKAVQDLSGGSATAQHLSALIWHAG